MSIYEEYETFKLGDKGSIKMLRVTSSRIKNVVVTLNYFSAQVRINDHNGPLVWLSNPQGIPPHLWGITLTGA